MALERLTEPNIVAEKTPVDSKNAPPSVTKTLELFSQNGGRATSFDLKQTLCPDSNDEDKADQIVASTISKSRKYAAENGKMIVLLEGESVYVLEDQIVLPNGKPVIIGGEKQRDAAKLLNEREAVTYQDLYPDELDATKGNRNIKGVVSKLRKPFNDSDYSIISKTSKNGITEYSKKQGVPKKEAKLKNGTEVKSKSSLQNSLTEFLSIAGEPIPTEALIELFFDPKDQSKSIRKLRYAMKDIQKRLRISRAVLKATPQSRKGFYLFELIQPTTSDVSSIYDEAVRDLPIPYKQLTYNEKRYLGYRLKDLRNQFDPENPSSHLKKEIDKIEEQLLIGHSRLIPFTSRKYRLRKKGFPDQDLYQAGLEGLTHAIKKYDPDKGALTTYAVYGIRTYMTRAIESHNQLGIKISPAVLENARKVAKKRNDLMQELGRNVAFTEAARHIDLSINQQDDARIAIRATNNAFSLNRPTGDYYRDELSTRIADNSALNPEEEAIKSSRSGAVLSILNELTDRQKHGENALTYEEQTAIQLRLGFKGGSDASFKEIGEFIGTTGKKASQIFSEGIKKIRNSAHAENLRELLAA